MLHDDRDYKVTLIALERLKEFLKSLGIDPKVNIELIKNVRTGIKDLRDEITEYEHHTNVW